VPRNIQVDWSRYHLQLLFVDKEDSGNARIAQCLLDKIAEWNGYGRSLSGWTCGTHAQHCSLERVVSLMLRAGSIGASAKTFTRVPEQLETRDLYTYDIIVAMDSSSQADALQIFNRDLNADWDSEENRTFYRQRVCRLHDFLSYASEAQLRERGAQSLVPRDMAKLFMYDLSRLRSLPDVQEAPLSRVKEWNEMFLTIMLCTAGLVAYLIDSCPEDLDYFWLE
jgi:protein-tyrosine-phosphatase